MVHHVQTTGDEQTLSAITGSNFDWSQIAILTTELPSDQRRQMVDFPSESQAKVTISNYTPQQVDITVDTPAAGMLILADNYYPGWRATLDGELITIYKANHTLRAVFVPEGEHSIQFLFRPRILQAALVISLTILALAGAIIWLDHRRNR